MADWEFQGQEATIYPQTIIFLYTDGLTEAEDATHAQFGKQRMAEMTRQTLYVGSEENAESGAKSDAKSLITLMSAAVARFVGDAEQSDDLTMLAIKYSKE